MYVVYETYAFSGLRRAAGGVGAGVCHTRIGVSGLSIVLPGLQVTFHVTT